MGVVGTPINLSTHEKAHGEAHGVFTVHPRQALFLFMFAFFLLYPIYQELLHHTFCQQDPSCPGQPKSHSRHSLYGSLLDATKERRVFLILPSVGATINALLIVVVQYTSPDYTWVYLIGAGLSGLTGGFSVFNLSAYSYAADISNHGDRTQRMGWLEATTYASSFLSQLIGGVSPYSE